MCDSNPLFPQCSSESFCAVLYGLKVGYDRGDPTSYHSCHCPRGLTGKEHLPSFSLDPHFSQTPSFSLTRHCEMARRSGAWRQRRRDIYLQKKHEQTEGGEGSSVERDGEIKSKVILLCTGVWRESVLDELGRRGGAIALLGCHSSCLPSPGTVCMMREWESSHISLAADTASWLAGNRVTPAGDGEDPHTSRTHRAV